MANSDFRAVGITGDCGEKIFINAETLAGILKGYSENFSVISSCFLDTELRS
jgi:hypothetical protein